MVTSKRFFLPCVMSVLALTAIAIWPDWLRSPWIERSIGDPAFGSPSVLLESSPEVEIIRRRCLAKSQVCARVVAGELDLFEASGHFRYLNHEPPEYPHLAYRQLPGETDDEKLCRQVILWVEVQYREVASVDEVNRLVAELETALASRSSRYGRIALQP